MQDFLGEVQAIDAHIAPATFTASVHTAGSQYSPGLAALSPGLQGYASACLPVEHPEEAVVRPCHNHAGSWRKGEAKGSKEREETSGVHGRMRMKRQTEYMRIDLMSVKLVSGIDLNVG